MKDLQYGQSGHRFRVFDVCTKEEKTVKWASHYNILKRVNHLNSRGATLDVVPLLYYGYFEDMDIEALTEGTSVIDSDQIKEGCVITLDNPSGRTNPELPCGGRIRLKSVSSSYKTRKDGTEYS